MTSAPKPVKDYFHREGEDFYRQYAADPNFRERLEVWTGCIDRYGRPGGTVLDVGCGPGVFSLYAAARGMRVTGLDPAENMLAICRRVKAERGLDDAVFIQAGLEALPELGLTAELVLCSSVLEYFDAPQQALATLARAVAPGGTLVVSLPNAASLFRKFDRLTYRLCGRPDYYRLLRTMSTPEAFAAPAASAGLAVVETALYAGRHRLDPLFAALPPRRTARLFACVLKKTAS